MYHESERPCYIIAPQASKKDADPLRYVYFDFETTVWHQPVPEVDRFEHQVPSKGCKYLAAAFR